MFYVLPHHHPQLKNVNLKAEATLAKGCLATSKAGRGDAACSSHCSRPARSQTCGGLKGTSTIVDWLFYNVSYALLTSFCMKDNPEVGFFLRGGRKGRKAWEIEEEATLVTINLTTLFPRWSSQVPWLGYSWWIASASLILSMSLCLYLSFVYVFVFVLVLCYLWNKTPVKTELCHPDHRTKDLVLMQSELRRNIEKKMTWKWSLSWVLKVKVHSRLGRMKVNVLFCKSDKK